MDGNKRNWILALVVVAVIVVAVVAGSRFTNTNDESDENATLLEFHQLVSLNLTTGTSIWGEVVFDGKQLVASYETGDELALRKFDENLNPVGSEAIAASTSDTGGEAISDHKHIFQGGYHYLVFSIAGSGAGGDLYLVKMDQNLTRVAITQVVDDDPPTNDMFLVGDGNHIFVGKFAPTTGCAHAVYEYDSDLNLVATHQEGCAENSHSNGASVVFVGDRFHVVAPGGLAPGGNFDFYVVVYDHDWDVVVSKKSIFNDSRGISLVTGLSVYGEEFIVHYLFGNGTYGIGRAVFDCQWNLLQNSTVYEGSFHAPHTEIVDNDLYLAYSNATGGYKAYLSKFMVSAK
ncbi:MAG: hypothetical protein ACTSU5_08465 [Promethearchaeota archaeon]